MGLCSRHRSISCVLSAESLLPCEDGITNFSV